MELENKRRETEFLENKRCEMEVDVKQNYVIKNWN